jgi:AraC-like DNA-binding protein
MVNQLNILLLFLGALQGVIMSLFLLRRNAAVNGRLYFCLFLVVVGLQLTFKGIAKSWLWDNAQPPYLLSYSLPFLIGPLLYLFVRSRTTSQQEFNMRDLLHATPFLIHFTNTLADILFGKYLLPSLVSQIFPHPSLDLISLLTYSVLSWRLLAEAGKEKNGVALKKFVVCVASVESVIIITIGLMVRNIETFPDVRLLFITLTALIYWVSYKLFASPELFLPASTGTSVLRVDQTVKYAHSGLKPEEADHIAALLRKAKDDRIFLEANISIDTVAARLGVPRHHLSRVINEQFSMTYGGLVNSARLEEARARLSDPRYKHHTIYAIALDSGFSTVSSFNTIFKRHFHSTPSAFRDLHLKQKTA